MLVIRHGVSVGSTSEKEISSLEKGKSACARISYKYALSIVIPFSFIYLSPWRTLRPVFQTPLRSAQLKSSLNSQLWLQIPATVLGVSCLNFCSLLKATWWMETLNILWMFVVFESLSKMGFTLKNLETYWREKGEKVRENVGTICLKNRWSCVISEQIHTVNQTAVSGGQVWVASGQPIRDHEDCWYCCHPSVWTFLVTPFSIILDLCDSKSLWLQEENWSPTEVEVKLFSCSSFLSEY